MVPTLIAAVVSFLATNIDDILLITFFFGNRVPTSRVVTGQFLGFAALVLCSLLGYVIRFAVPQSWIGLLGIIPILIGLKKLTEINRQTGEDETIPPNFSVSSIAAVTFSNGGDNVGIYTPQFATLDFRHLLVTIITFFILLAAWCALGYFLGNLKLIRRLIERYGTILVPFALIGLGVFIIVHSRTL